MGTARQRRWKWTWRMLGCCGHVPSEGGREGGPTQATLVPALRPEPGAAPRGQRPSLQTRHSLQQLCMPGGDQVPWSSTARETAPGLMPWTSPLNSEKDGGCLWLSGEEDKGKKCQYFPTTDHLAPFSVTMCRAGPNPCISLFSFVSL